jgi:signal transduction histidine kinase
LVIEEPLPLVLADRARLREILANLLSNAVKFLDKRPGRVEVSAMREGDDVVLCIADNGPGIPDAEQQRIFSPFRRLPSHRHLPGSGLGLYFTRNMVEQLRGQIWVRSQPGEGSQFFLTLPAARD